MHASPYCQGNKYKFKAHGKHYCKPAALTHYETCNANPTYKTSVITVLKKIALNNFQTFDLPQLCGKYKYLQNTINSTITHTKLRNIGLTS